MDLYDQQNKFSHTNHLKKGGSVSDMMHHGLQSNWPQRPKVGPRYNKPLPD